MQKILFVLLLTVLAPLTGIAAILKGKITDDHNEPLAFATVYVKGTTLGTSANAQGEYQLSLEPGSYTIICQYIGFSQSVYTATVSGNEVVTHHFQLREQALEMKEVVVRANGEDPAYRIMRQVIGQRSRHLKQVRSFQTGIYLKGVLRSRSAPSKFFGEDIDAADAGLDSSGKGILYLCEEHAEYFSKGNKQRTLIHSVKESGDPNGLGFSQLPPVITFYENNITIFEQLNPRGFISPAAENALSYYNYKLLGEYNENSNTIYKIRVTPKRLYEPTFRGYIYIVDEDWAIHSLDFTLTSQSNMETLDTLKIEQVYLPLAKDVWVIKNQVIYPVVGMLGFNFTGNCVTVYNGQKVNESIPDTIFNDKIISIYDKTANKKDSTFWNASRPIKLEQDEINDYALKDSLRRRQQNPAFVDSMRRAGNKVAVKDILLNGISLNGKAYKQAYQTNALVNALNFNTAEGLYFAPKLTWTYQPDTGHFIRARIAPRYSFANGHFNGMASLGYTKASRSWRGRAWGLTAEGGQYVYQINGANPIKPLLNTFSSLLFRQNYMKLYERQDAAIRFAVNRATGWRYSLKLAYQRRMPLENSTDYNWAGPRRAPYTPNNPPELLAAYPWEAHNAALATVTVSYQPGFRYVQFPDYKVAAESELPVFTLQYQKGIPGILDSKTDFDKWRFSINDEVRLKLLGLLSYDIAAGGFLNDRYVGLPDLMHLKGNELVFANTYMQSFQLAPYYRFSNTEPLYGELHLEYKLQGLLTNKIPMLKQLHWYLLLGNNTFYANNQRFYTEAFAGIDNIGYKLIRFLRVDFVYGWDSFRQNTYGIRIGIKPNPLFNVKLDDTQPNSDW